MINFKQYCKRFIEEYDGMELLQVEIIVLIAAALATVIWQLARNVQSKLESAQNAVDNIDIKIEDSTTKLQ